MGLDMYLEKRTYIWNRNGTDLHITGTGVEHVNPERVKEIVEEVGYWRKANAIHQWFVKNVQSGKDDCGTYYVDREQIRALLALVDRVLAAIELVDGEVTNGYTYRDGEKVPIIQWGKTVKDASLAHELLPAMGGFFFGSTDYDEGYVDDLNLTKEICTAALADGERGASFYYHSSW